MVEIKRHEVRRARPEDACALVDLVKRGMPGYPFESVYDVAAVEQSLVSPTDYRVVCVDNDGRIVGTAVLGESGDHMQEIKRVVVDPALRRNGVASELTKYLVWIANNVGIIPWMDARADQPGIQRAGLKAGLTALSLETGKHCVYYHLNQDGLQIGPGRETMVHITSLTPDLADLAAGFAVWPLDLVEQLVANMNQALMPQLKKTEVVNEYLPSAVEVRQRIESQLGNNESDMAIVSWGGTKMVVVKPDASGFIVNVDSKGLLPMIQWGHEMGLQTVTTYMDIAQVGKLDLLVDAGMSPTMIRLNQVEPSVEITWQVGWRSTANGFDDCLHTINLDEEIVNQVNKLISEIP